MIRAPEHLSTQRLHLRKPILADADVVFQTYARDPEVTRYLTWRPDQTLEEVRTFLERVLECWTKGTSYTWSITVKDTAQLVGMIEARVDQWHINIGYVLAKKYWNSGYMTEAVKAVTEWALAHPEIFRVWAVCDVENIPSARVLEKAGMQKEGILRRWMILPNKSDAPRNCFCYAKVK